MPSKSTLASKDSNNPALHINDPASDLHLTPDMKPHFVLTGETDYRGPDVPKSRDDHSADDHAADIERERERAERERAERDRRVAVLREKDEDDRSMTDKAAGAAAGVAAYFKDAKDAIADRFSATSETARRAGEDARDVAMGATADAKKAATRGVDAAKRELEDAKRDFARREDAPSSWRDVSTADAYGGRMHRARDYMTGRDHWDHASSEQKALIMQKAASDRLDDLEDGAARAWASTKGAAKDAKDAVADKLTEAKRDARDAWEGRSAPRREDSGSWWSNSDREIARARDRDEDRAAWARDRDEDRAAWARDREMARDRFERNRYSNERFDREFRDREFDDVERTARGGSAGLAAAVEGGLKMDEQAEKRAEDKRTEEAQRAADKAVAEKDKKVADTKKAADDKAAEAKKAAESKAADAKKAVDDKTADLKKAAESKGADLKKASEQKAADLKKADAKASEAAKKPADPTEQVTREASSDARRSAFDETVAGVQPKTATSVETVYDRQKASADAGKGVVEQAGIRGAAGQDQVDRQIDAQKAKMDIVTDDQGSKRAAGIAANAKSAALHPKEEKFGTIQNLKLHREGSRSDKMDEEWKGLKQVAREMNEIEAQEKEREAARRGEYQIGDGRRARSSSGDWDRDRFTTRSRGDRDARDARDARERARDISREDLKAYDDVAKAKEAESSSGWWWFSKKDDKSTAEEAKDMLRDAKGKAVDSAKDAKEEMRRLEARARDRQHRLEDEREVRSRVAEALGQEDEWADKDGKSKGTIASIKDSIAEWWEGDNDDNDGLDRRDARWRDAAAARRARENSLGPKDASDYAWARSRDREIELREERRANARAPPSLDSRDRRWASDAERYALTGGVFTPMDANYPSERDARDRAREYVSDRNVQVLDARGRAIDYDDRDYDRAAAGPRVLSPMGANPRDIEGRGRSASPRSTGLSGRRYERESRFQEDDLYNGNHTHVAEPIPDLTDLSDPLAQAGAVLERSAGNVINSRPPYASMA